ncbi:MAG: VPLPA-CTERM sorting domain-containing protein [Bacteroidota bacterium]
MATVPVPAAVWLFGSGLLGLVGVARRRNARSTG